MEKVVVIHIMLLCLGCCYTSGILRIHPWDLANGNEFAERPGLQVNLVEGRYGRVYAFHPDEGPTPTAIEICNFDPLFCLTVVDFNVIRKSGIIDLNAPRRNEVNILASLLRYFRRSQRDVDVQNALRRKLTKI